MDRIRKIFPAIKEFASRERLLLIDFWSDSEEARAQGENAISQMGETLHSLRENVEHHKFVCTEEQIYELPKSLLNTDYDGIVILPPLGRDRGTGDILSALLVRQQLARQTVADQRSLFPEDDATKDDELTQFWANAPRGLIKQRDLAAFIITLALSAVTDDTAVTIVSSNTLLSGGIAGRLREAIQRETTLRFIIELGGKWDGMHPNVQFAAVSLDSGKSEDQLVRLFKVPTAREMDLDAISDDFQRLGRQQGGSTQYGYVLRSGLPAKGGWLVEAHHPRWEQYLHDLQELGEVRTLRELGRLFKPVTPPGSRWSQEETNWPAVHPQQIRADGTIDFDDIDDIRYWPEQPPNTALRLMAGDVVIRELRASTDATSPLRLAVVPEMSQPWYLGAHTLLFRFHDEVEPDSRRYVLAYLSSLEAASWVYARSTGVNVQTRLFEELPVPVPDKGVLTAFRQLRRAHDQLREWAQQLKDVESRQFRFSTLREAQKELLEVSAGAQQRVVAASSTDTLSWRIRNLYPHPLAFRWRTIEIQEPNLEKYMEELRAAEVCVAYAATMGCSLTEILGGEYELQAVARQTQAFQERPGTGVTFWTWVSIIEELQSRRFRDIDQSTPFVEVTQLFESNPDLSEVINDLMRKRNDMAHDRGPSGFELDKVLEITEDQLETLFESLDFVSRYPLHDISNARRAGRRQRGIYSCEVLVGDHPVPPRRNVEFEGNTPATGLHMVDQAGIPHFIEPWLIRRRCQKCKHEETYILDRYMRDGTIMFKSLEYGHELDASDLCDELNDVGIDLRS